MVREHDEQREAGTASAAGGDGTRQRLEALTRVVELAVARPRAADRLRAAGTSVAITAAGAPDAGVTLRLDRPTPTVERGADARAEVSLRLRDDEPDLLARSPHLAMRIAAGEVVARGPVRRFLRVVPVLRAVQEDAT